MKKLAKERGVAESITRLAVKDLRCKSYAQPVRHLVTDQQKMTRVERCRVWPTSSRGVLESFFFTDNKVFVQDVHVNHRNSKILARSSNERDYDMMFRTNYPVSVIVLGLVVSDGNRLPLIQFKP